MLAPWPLSLLCSGVVFMLVLTQKWTSGCKEGKATLLNLNPSCCPSNTLLPSPAPMEAPRTSVSGRQLQCYSWPHEEVKTCLRKGWGCSKAARKRGSRPDWPCLVPMCAPRQVPKTILGPAPPDVPGPRTPWRWGGEAGKRIKEKRPLLNARAAQTSTGTREMGCTTHLGKLRQGSPERTSGHAQRAQASPQTAAAPLQRAPPASVQSPSSRAPLPEDSADACPPWKPMWPEELGVTKAAPVDQT